mmetsp:Transcript_48289/g.151442  ORF Transcript_48289/g.151442 Transcript_48289/m.151442 type:complete len:317 (+) Transcript_48289:1032-1982(+)
MEIQLRTDVCGSQVSPVLPWLDLSGSKELADIEEQSSHLRAPNHEDSRLVEVRTCAHRFSVVPHQFAVPRHPDILVIRLPVKFAAGRYAFANLFPNPPARKPSTGKLVKAAQATMFAGTQWGVHVGVYMIQHLLLARNHVDSEGAPSNIPSYNILAFLLPKILKSTPVNVVQDDLQRILPGFSHEVLSRVTSILMIQNLSHHEGRASQSHIIRRSSPFLQVSVPISSLYGECSKLASVGNSKALTPRHVVSSPRVIRPNIEDYVGRPLSPAPGSVALWILDEMDRKKIISRGDPGYRNPELRGSVVVGQDGARKLH